MTNTQNLRVAQTEAPYPEGRYITSSVRRNLLKLRFRPSELHEVLAQRVSFTFTRILKVVFRIHVTVRLPAQGIRHFVQYVYSFVGREHEYMS